MILWLLPIATASQTVSGDRMRVHYDDVGTWNSEASAAGLQAYQGDAWVDYSFPGTPFQTWRLAWDDGGSAPEEYYATSMGYETNASVVSESDESTSSVAVATYVYEAGDVALTKTEAWLVDSTVMLVHFTVENTDTRTLSDMRLFFAVDPDQDYSISSANTLNDVQDGDGDGIDDLVMAVGPSSGRTIAFAACDASQAELGFHDGWSETESVDVLLTDDDGASGDSAMAVRMHLSDDLGAGETAEFSLLVVVGEDADEALTLLGGAVDYCEDCDVDGDGYLAEACGGSDCDDDDADISPGATETYYDGVDSDCDGGDDYDADGDGYQSDAHGGDDCDDTDPDVNPGASDTVYDGIDSDCDDASDYDADGDGYDSAGHGGDDCNDADPDVNPGADDIDGDGEDSDCDGSDGAGPDDTDTDGGGDTDTGSDPVSAGGCGCAAPAAGPTGAWLLVGLLPWWRRRR